MEMDIVVYTANMDRYDELPPVSGGRYVCFADQPLEADGWEVRMVDRVLNHPKAEALRFKCLPHLSFPDADAWIWMDAHLSYKGTPDELLQMAGDHEITTCPHPLYNCVYAEMRETVRARYRNTDPLRVREQEKGLLGLGYPAENGLALTTLMVRRNTPAVRQMNEAWWADICRWHTWRDQFSFDPVCWQLGLEFGHIVDGDLRYDPDFDWKGHRCASS